MQNAAVHELQSDPLTRLGADKVNSSIESIVTDAAGECPQVEDQIADGVALNELSFVVERDRQVVADGRVVGARPIAEANDIPPIRTDENTPGKPSRGGVDRLPNTALQDSPKRSVATLLRARCIRAHLEDESTIE